MGHVPAWPLFGPLSWRPVTGSCRCVLIDGRVLVDASSGCRVISRAVETVRWGAWSWPWWWPGATCPHWIGIAIVFMKWLITLDCVYLFLFLTNKCYPCIEVAMYYHV